VTQGLVTLAELAASDFWSFFNIRETGRSSSESGVAVTLATGGFAEHIALSLNCDETGEIGSAALRLRRSWVTGPPWGINPFANDVTASWLTALVPGTDSARFAPLADEIRSLQAGETFKAKVEDQAWIDGLAGQLALAYVGLVIEPFACRGEITQLTVETNKHPDGTDWITLRLQILSRSGASAVPGF
jgi:hypothetical protein